MIKNNLIFIGLSHLSLNYGVTAAKKYSSIHFIDFKKKIDTFEKKELIYDEPKLNNYLNKYKKKIVFSSKLPLINKNTILFLAIDVKTYKNNKSNYSYINKLLKFINLKIVEKNIPLIIMSQVQPNFTRKVDWPIKKLYYQVETLVFGNAINRAENPERIIVGTFDGNKARDKNYLRYLNTFKCNSLFMKYEEAELCKMFINSYLVANVSLTNNLANICKKLNLNWFKPKKALMLDKRIGEYAYLNPGLGISGGNLERDIVNLNKINKQLKINSSLFSVFLKESNNQKKWLVRIINTLIRKKLLTQKNKVGLIGISYKENTNSLKNSPSLILLSKLKNFNLYCYDKILIKNSSELINIKWQNLETILKECDIIFIMHNENKINNILRKINLIQNKKIIIDPYNNIEPNIINHLKYYDSL